MANFNTVAGCILASALFAMVVGKVSNAVVHPHKLDKPAIAVVDEAPTAVAAAPAAELPPIGPLLAKANVEAGKAIYMKQCFTCHTIDKGGANKVGPNLWGVVGRARAEHPGFDYSSAMMTNHEPWSFDKLFHYLKAPQADVPGTKMSFAGLRSAQDRINLIAYLRTLADSPAPIPPPEKK